ncbi:hypothetical protein A3A38_04255 [Candidatus Kaiserbacteria bacterium RIFCSPLOWO2_01_FULL_53_17]|uniref:Transcription regulator TrmB N-terminal domain-containing protein n=1 Tax=Candidatus Kaiserbacteria bacterium RIFCSPLOWO2_01_FULL_53_17 TaxID=1798511 RepID=A0A1F6EHF6_9BACT|nr:MAG: hypothetical protein A3A38_04255 [Candidatus Kaiserbacteria bacterium RIFCSPLOWO2_01_FULL_53_17]
MSTLPEELSKIGLTEKEAKIYASTLELGPTTALEIARKTDIKRPTVYTILESLKQRGLIEVQLLGLKRKFAAANPDQFDAIISEQKKRFDMILPDLLALYKLRGSKSQIKYYEGIEGVKAVYETMLREIRTGDSYYAITDAEKWAKLDQKWFEYFIERRTRRKLDARIIFADTERGRQNMKTAVMLQQKVKVTKNTIDADISICPQRYVVHSFTPPIAAVVIENEEIIKTQLALFRHIWNTLR